jgi:hypothetical protein
LPASRRLSLPALSHEKRPILSQVLSFSMENGRNGSAVKQGCSNWIRYSVLFSPLGISFDYFPWSSSARYLFRALLGLMASLSAHGTCNSQCRFTLLLDGVRLLVQFYHSETALDRNMPSEIIRVRTGPVDKLPSIANKCNCSCPGNLHM